MIFISHNSKDKPIVEPIAKKLADIFGKGKVFYDSWSIQPGDSLVGKINTGLEECRFFLLFVSKNSLDSEMVNLEWKNALIKKTKGQLRLIPIRLEKVQMPTLLTDTLFIDTANCDQTGIVQQIIDVVEGKNTYRDDMPGTGFHNLIAYSKKIDTSIEIEFQAQQYMEPVSKFLILVENDNLEIEVTCPRESKYEFNFYEKITLSDGKESKAVYIGIDRPTTPGFPFVAILKKKKNRDIKILGAMKAVAHNMWVGVPLIQ